jgi:hypothetical protein
MGLRTMLLAGTVLILPACFCGGSTGGGAGGGSGGGGGAPVSLGYDLVEASGEWSLTATTSNSSCTTATTSSRRTISLPSVQSRAATYSSRSGSFGGTLHVGLTNLPREGTVTCTTGAPRPCQSTLEPTTTSSPSLSLKPLTALGSNPPAGLAFIPVLSGLTRPDLCQTEPFDVSGAWLRGKPITISQLESGRFVVEAQGSLPLVNRVPQFGDSDPQPVTGTLTYSFKLVFQTASYDPSKAVAATELTTYEECLLDVDPTGNEVVGAAAAFEAGAVDIPLNSTGCRRLKIVRATEALTVKHELTRGTKLTFDPATGTTRSERDAILLYESTIDSTGIHERHDVSPDGGIDRLTETTFSDAGLWLATTSTQTGPSPQKLTRTRIDDTTMWVREERSGTLIDEFVAPITQKSCFEPNDAQAPDCAPTGGVPPVCTNVAAVPCPAAKQEEFLKALTEATARGQKCMKNAGMAFDPSAKILTLISEGRLKFLCSSDPCDDLGSFQTNPNSDKKKTHDFMINLERTKAAGELTRTLFHESLHADNHFTHNTNLVRAASNACKLQIVDRTFACETMCFNPGAADSCTCKRCLSDERHKVEDKVCTKCEAFGACAARRENAMPVSSAIGAWCERGKVFCDTKAECDTRCVGFGSCNQIKATCDAGCN